MTTDLKKIIVSGVKKLLLSAHSILKKSLISMHIIPEKDELRISNVKSILLIRLDGLGDLVLSTPAIRNIRHICPKASITILVKKGLGGIFDKLPWVDNFWEIFVSPKRFLGILKFVLQLRKYKFGLAVDLMTRSDFLSSAILGLTKAHYKAGYDVGWRSLFLDIKTKPTPEPRYEVNNVLEIVRTISDKPVDSSLFLPVETKAQEFIGERFKEWGISGGELLIGIHPGVAKLYMQKKAWPPEKFSQLADILVEKYKARVFLTGSPDDVSLCQGIVQQMKRLAVNISGEISITQLVALINKLNLFISNHSGPFQIAVAMNIPTVVISGPTDLNRWGPYGENHIVVKKDLNCIPCERLGRKCLWNDFRCIKTITVEDVLESVDRQLNRKITCMARLNK